MLSTLNVFRFTFCITRGATARNSLAILRLTTTRPYTTGSPRTLFRFSPWSNHFCGSLRTRILLQSGVYASLIVGLMEASGVCINPSIVSFQLTDQPHEKSYGPTQYASPGELKIAIQELKAEFPDPQSITMDPGALRTHGFSENSYHPMSPHSIIVGIQSLCLEYIFYVLEGLSKIYRRRSQNRQHC